MKHIFLNLKRFDISPAHGGVNRLAPMADWGRTIVEKTQDALRGGVRLADAAGVGAGEDGAGAVHDVDVIADGVFEFLDDARAVAGGDEHGRASVCKIYKKRSIFLLQLQEAVCYDTSI